MKYQVTRTAWFLYDVGVSFYETDTLSRNGVKVFDYYKADSITQEQREKILQWCPQAEFKAARSMFAPEIKGVIICFPKAGYWREREALLREGAKEQARQEFHN